MFKATIAAALTAVLIPAASIGASADGAGTATTVTGAKQHLGAGTVWSWVRTTANGEAAEFGLSIDEDGLRALGDKPLEVALPLPAQANFPFRTAVLDWNPQGHPPAHVYDVPHFDFHFYTIPEAERMAIAPEGPRAAATPSPSDLPAGFVTDGQTVPMMGKHYVPADAPEFHGGTFTATPIYGYYGGRLIFVESMVTLAYLKTHPRAHAGLAQPARFPVAGAYPTTWSVQYDEQARRYDVTFGELNSRVADVAP